MWHFTAAVCHEQDIKVHSKGFGMVEKLEWIFRDVVEVIQSAPQPAVQTDTPTYKPDHPTLIKPSLLHYSNDPLLYFQGGIR